MDIGNHPIDNGVSDLELSSKVNMSDKDLNSLIDALCETRAENQDVVLMDNIQRQRIIMNPIEEEKMGIQHDQMQVDQEIMHDLFKGMDNAPLESDEMIRLTQSGIYDAYMQNKQLAEGEDIMNDIENELKQNLEANTLQEGQVVDDETFRRYTEGAMENSEDVSANPVVETEAVNEETTEPLVQSFVNSVMSGQFTNGTPYTDVRDIDPTNPELQKALVETLDKVARENTEKYGNPKTSEEVHNGMKDAMSKEILVSNVTTDHIPSEEMEIKDVDFNDIDLNDVDFTSVDVDDTIITSAVNEFNLEAKEAMDFINVINRFKSGEKFNVFEALPSNMKNEIARQAMQVGADKSTMNFFAKQFINEIINDAYMDKTIKDFNTELKEAFEPMNNMMGNMLDEYSEEVDTRFTVDMRKKADEIKDSDPEKAEQLLRVAQNYEEAHNYSRIMSLITDKPSACNRAYKKFRDSWASVCNDFNEKYDGITPRLKSPQEIAAAIVHMGYELPTAGTIAVLIVDSINQSMAVDTIEEHIYSYYVGNSVINTMMSAGKNKSLQIASGAINEMAHSIGEYLSNLMNNKRTNRKDRKKHKKASR